MEQYVFYFLYNIEGATEKLYKFDTRYFVTLSEKRGKAFGPYIHSKLLESHFTTKTSGFSSKYWLKHDV
jgi:hypothetical protein